MKNNKTLIGVVDGKKIFVRSFLNDDGDDQVKTSCKWTGCDATAFPVSVIKKSFCFSMAYSARNQICHISRVRSRSENSTGLTYEPNFAAALPNVTKFVAVSIRSNVSKFSKCSRFVQASFVKIMFRRLVERTNCLC
ncbi:hypothetical protein L596_026381 [Steinernema carpocapsae]|uniref:Uncharacterized protein n=1 Tax=Steinernema carpocapsae TaxID=34508 RepID=A0A4U5M1B0_STECR|nr:hypothetical protein L596_026381 [Steinernema carpocapsae]